MCDKRMQQRQATMGGGERCGSAGELGTGYMTVSYGSGRCRIAVRVWARVWGLLEEERAAELQAGDDDAGRGITFQEFTWARRHAASRRGSLVV